MPSICASVPYASASPWISRTGQRIAAIRCPVLLVQGEADAYGTLAQIDGIVGRVPQAQRLMLPGVGHSPHREAREAVIEACVRFLASLPV